ncbi:glycosyltransferase [Sulfurihydrogenibium sp.]|uniref:glycosyltransferase n=1 Tax=Sulfurihydrogenibium sp. TaxID=2053621 RepID=UPI002632D482|nr:glycosyltransferase [Sulfurihydrogenibium sp.]
MIKVDLHLHSEASNKPGGYLSQKLKISESYVKPIKLYNILKERGMTLVTITDHDTIDGCLDIAHLPDTFISEEITTYFPEDRCKVHVIAIDINEKQHNDIQHLRGNIYELVDYLQKNNITHILAHPLYDMDGKLKKEHIEKFVLLFDNWEILNGTRSRTSSFITEKIAKSFTKEKLETLANKYNIYKRRRDFIGFTGGSDDHGGIDIGTGYTIAEGKTLEDLKKAINEGKTYYDGEYGNPKKLTHMVMNIGKEGIKRNYNIGNLGYLLDNLFEPKQQTSSILDQILGRNSVNIFIENVIKFRNQLSNNHHENIFNFFSNLLPYTINQMKNQKTFDFDKISMYLGKAMIFSSVYLAYISVYKQRADEKNISLRFHKEFFGNGHSEGKVAYLTDTFFEINGVSRTTQKLFKLVQEENYNMQFLISHQKKIESDYLKIFEPVFTFALPEYEDIPINIPNFLEVLDYIESENFDVIYSATPGIMGVYGLIISKILGIPFVTAYHTDFPEYVYRYTNDHVITEVVKNLIKLFYNSADRVLVPSNEFFKRLSENSVNPDKLVVFKRGVNQEKFNPSYRDRKIWKNYFREYNGEFVVLYVGRVSKEKDLDVFIQVYEKMKNNSKVKFAIVGDGPYRKELESTYGDKIAFTGFLEGEALAKAYASADFFLFPSTTETFGNVVLEAMASGLIPLVSDKGAAKENIVKDITGFVVENNNPDEYRILIERLIQNESLRNNIKKNIQQYIKNFDEKELLYQMLETLSLGLLSKQKQEVVV